ncbi:MAG: hypothetical protein JW847_01075 [Candidatus Omnitrophica bacterium]|nr:hypothetical protein [Candidatus Omnitrophota bacterium]
MPAFNRIDHLPEFDRDLKKMKKHYRSLDNDLEIFKKTQLILFHKLNKDNQGLVPIANLGIECPKIYKARKFACRTLKGTGANSGIRVIYAYYEAEDKIEMVEIYYKGDKANEDRERLKRRYGK